MGAGGSVQTNEANTDPVCNSQESQQQLQTNVLQPKEITHDAANKENGVTIFGEEQWLKQIQDLGKIIQNLACENVKLLNSNKEWKKRCEKFEEKHTGVSKYVEVACGNEQTINNLKEEVLNDKTLIKNLTEQLQTKTENSALEVEKYHENINFMKMKLKEYEQVVLKLEKDAASQNSTIQSLQNSIVCVYDEKKMSEQNITEMKGAFQKLEQELKESREENISLCKQIDEEKSYKKNVFQENKKLSDELKHIKLKDCENPAQRLSENSDVDFSAEAESSTSGGDAEKSEETKTLSPKAAAELEVFQKQLRVKREARHKALSAISGEMERLRRELNCEREARRNVLKELQELRNISSAHEMYDELNDLKRLLLAESEAKDRLYKEMVQVQKEGNEEIENTLKELDKEKEKSNEILKENKFLKEQLEESDQSLQTQSEENNQLQNKLESDREKYQHQVAALKDVISLTKQMLTVRENQVTHLKRTVQDIEASVIQKHHGSLTADLKAEYETQIENIKALKTLYEERTHIMNAENEKLINKEKELQNIIEEEKTKVEDLELKLQEKNMLISERDTKVSNLQDQLSDALDQSRNLSEELTLINNMFTQILGSNDVDLDRLTKLLQENHDLITEITTKGECSETTASLPKLLLDLVCDVEDAENKERDDKEQEIKEIKELDGETSGNIAQDTAQQVEDKEEEKVPETVISVNGSGATLAIQDISSNLPKVWRVLLELISHHVPSPSDETTEELKTSCYKSVDTPYGPKNVISVSKTFLRLRDLILQKKSLQKEVTRLKQLNVHLETKLNDQERRLSTVSTELRKTWNVVDHMRIQHQQLHTHEKVLRYELQQKRKLLTELKEELEYCKEKWDDARQKNSQSEIEWQKLRTEFALRKSKPNNNSGESGFSDEKEDGVPEVDVGKMCQPTLPIRSEEDIPKHDNMEAVNNSSSLPDLLSVTTDIPVSQPEVASINILSTISNVNEDSLSNLQNMDQSNVTFTPGSNKSAVTDPPVLEECSTVSLITLLKEQLSCFSKNLEIITAGFDTNDHFKALQSIFALPAIQIPDHLNPTISETSLLRGVSENIATKLANVKGGSSFPEENLKVCDDDREDLTNKGLVSCSEEKITTTKPNDLEDIKYTASPNNCSNLPEGDTSLSAFCSENTSSLSTEGVQQETRSARIQRLQRQCSELFDKVTQGSVKNTNTMEENIKPKDDSKGSSKSLEDVLDARAARLKRLEEQSNQLFKKVKRTTHRSEALSNRLEELHEQYGSDEAPSPIASTSFDSSLNNIPIPPPVHNHLLPSENQASSVNAASSSPITLPSTSNTFPTPPPLEEMIDARAARLKRLEEQSQQLFKKVERTTHRSEALSNRLEELHEQYRSHEADSNETDITSTNQSMNSTSVPTPFSANHYSPQVSNNCENIPPQSVSTFNSTPILSSPEYPFLAEESPPQSTSVSNSIENEVSQSNYIPIPPPLPTVFPTIRLPSEIGDVSLRADTLERIQNAEEDPT